MHKYLTAPLIQGLSKLPSRLSISRYKGPNQRSPPASLMSAFEMVVVGCSGGPNETDLSAYLFKPSAATWESGIVALEAGSGVGALSRLLQSNPKLFDNEKLTAAQVYSFVQCYLITHAHLDHVNSLVLSSGGFIGPRKRVYAAQQTLENLETVFADRIWPNLASWEEDDDPHKLLYTLLPSNSKYHVIMPNVSVRSFPLNHGHNDTGTYESSAFFIRLDEGANKEFLFFGDVEPDSIVARPRTLSIWKFAAPKIPETLSTIFIECSWPLGRQEDQLYGHLSPEHLADELTVLATEVVSHRQNDPQTDASTSRPQRKRQKKNPVTPEELRGSLNGLRVFIIHCKDNLDNSANQPIRDIILNQVRGVIEPKELGVEILAAHQGMSIQI
ncbi:cAMP phosphodiesterases class-II-domain-containing protein [Mycena floridula]|nr:cAMP phosphodiesterases class-II-domain-containing protein [Mycena floridula]